MFLKPSISIRAMILVLIILYERLNRVSKTSIFLKHIMTHANNDSDYYFAKPPIFMEINLIIGKTEYKVSFLGMIQVYGTRLLMAIHIMWMQMV